MAQLSIESLAAADGVSALNSLTGSITLAGAGEVGITVSGQTITISGTPHTGGGGGSGTISNALVGSDGITVTSGIDTDTISGFYAEFTNASGTLSSALTTHTAVVDAHHVRYTDAEAIAALGPTTSALAASGVATDANIVVVSGHLSTEIDTDITTHAAISSAHHARYSKDENDALTGSDGITIVSGSNTIDIQGFHTEFTSASGTWVKKTGDTMTGNLLINNANLKVGGTVSGTSFYTGDVSVSGLVTLDANKSIPAGIVNLISVPSTAIQNGEGNNINVLTAFLAQNITKINSIQGYTTSATFIAQNKFTETGAIPPAHVVFIHAGMASSPEYTVSHNGTSGAPVGTLTGYEASPRVYRESGYTGNALISKMNGFVTNAPNALRAAFGAQQLKPGFTISKYAHFEANSDVAGGLLNTVPGATVTEEVGLDLQNINVGTTKISVRSTATGASMRHAGPATFGANRAPQAGKALDAEGDLAVKGNVMVSGTSGHGYFGGDLTAGVASGTGVILNGTSYSGKFTVINDNLYQKDTIFTKYSNNYQSQFVLARAKGTKASPGALGVDDYMGSFEFWGHDGTQFEQGAWFGAKVWGTVGTNELPAGLRFWVRGIGAATPDSALDIKCNKVLNLNGRQSVQDSNVVTAGLNADVNDYDPEGVAADQSPRLLWRLTANSAARTITGILAPTFPSLTDSQFLYIINVGATYNIILANQSASSTDVNRIITGTGASLTLGPDQTAILLYDNFTDRWRVLARNF